MVKIGVIGAGKWGQNHIRTLHQMGFLHGISDVNPATKDIADQYKVKHFLAYQDLIKEVDAVTVVAPSNLHYPIVKYCLDQKKHVLVEKPVTLNAEQTRSLVKLAYDSDLILSVGYLYRFNAAVIALKKILRSFGPIHYITMRYVHSSKPPRSDSGSIINLGIHLIDILNFCLPSRPKSVYCTKSNLLSATQEDSAAMTLDFGDFFATMEISCAHPDKKRDMWIIGEKEKIYVDLLEQKIIRHPFIVTPEGTIGEKNIDFPVSKNEPLKEELEHFAACIEDFDPLDKDAIHNIGKEEYFTTLICELALDSAKYKQNLRLPNE